MLINCVAYQDGRKLGDLLVEKGALTGDQLQEALRQQVGLVVQELCRWAQCQRTRIRPTRGWRRC